MFYSALQRRGKQHSIQRTLHIDVLESRQLMAADLAVVEPPDAGGDTVWELCKGEQCTTLKAECDGTYTEWTNDEGVTKGICSSAEDAELSLLTTMRSPTLETIMESVATPSTVDDLASFNARSRAGKTSAAREIPSELVTAVRNTAYLTFEVVEDRAATGSNVHLKIKGDGERESAGMEVDTVCDKGSDDILYCDTIVITWW